MTKINSNIVNSIIASSHLLPHDRKFPYIEEFSTNLKEFHEQNRHREEYDLEYIINNYNNKINQNSKKRNWSAISSATVQGLFSGVGAILGFCGINLPWFSTAGTGSSYIAGGGNAIFGATYLGAKLNRDIEGRGYFLKHLEDISLHLTADLIYRTNQEKSALQELQEKIKELDNTKQDYLDIEKQIEIKQKNITQIEEINSKIKQDLLEFQKIHYQSRPFYYKWSAQIFRQIFSPITSLIRFLMPIGLMSSIIAPQASIPVIAGLSGFYILCESIGSFLYSKSHSLRNNNYCQNAQQIDNIFDNICQAYKVFGIKIDNSTEIINAELAKEILKDNEIIAGCNHKHHHKKNHNHSHGYNKNHSHNHANLDNEHNEHNHNHSSSCWINCNNKNQLIKNGQKKLEKQESCQITIGQKLEKPESCQIKPTHVHFSFIENKIFIGLAKLYHNSLTKISKKIDSFCCKAKSFINSFKKPKSSVNNLKQQIYKDYNDSSNICLSSSSSISSGYNALNIEEIDLANDTPSQIIEKYNFSKKTKIKSEIENIANHDNDNVFDENAAPKNQIKILNYSNNKNSSGGNIISNVR